MKIIFLGLGYLGYNLSKALNAKYDVEVWGIDSPYVKYTPWFKHVDVFDLALMLNKDLKDAIVIDTVSLVGNRTKSDNEKRFIDDLVFKYQGLIDVLKAKGVKRYIYFSSGGTIYGDCDLAISEKHILNPKSLYGKSKKALEEALMDSGLDYVILRPSNPYGGFQVTKGQGVIPILIDKILNDEAFDMYVDENSVRDYFYISDFADGLDRIIQSDINKEIFNIGSGVPTSLRTVIDLVEKDCQKSLTVNKLQIDDTAVKSVVLDISKLKNMVGYEPKISLQDGIRLEVERLERGI